MSLRKFMLPIVILLILLTSGCAVSRAYLITVDENSTVTISVNGFEVLKEGISEGQTPEVDVTVPLVPGM